jgi:hypothetical protein
MQAAGKISLAILNFITDVLLLSYKMINRLVLPSRRRKGNLLTSLFILTTCILERLVTIERDILRKPLLFRNRHIRQGLQIAAAVFIFVSSFEWSGERVNPCNHAITCNNPASSGKTFCINEARLFADKAVFHEQILSPVPVPVSFRPSSGNYPFPPAAKTYLFIRNLRI